ncbi:hypothetical protein DESAMIL20_1272 [Desulfurella amilsii]|uniref:Transcriptional regulator HTH-type FeoC domain-containing protein n=1 Tax=Desulfurella amilsii TaxID=1562698 RepID=A0A1X4XW00_9BACT|nr:hypothetical protein [Desulfurella amilsii]OSS41719.1 hypothetical protein DESAMIL20_1272 [Desulfurella amilsii]
MKEYILHLLRKQKSLTFDNLLKKTNLRREILLQVIFKLAKENKIYFIDLSKASQNSCSMCSAKIFCEKKEAK